MTEREKFHASEIKRKMLSAVPTCPVCHAKPTTQLAHRIPQGKRSTALYSKNTIHHRFNLVPVCGLKCNAAVLIGGNPILKSALIHAIILDISGDTEIALDILNNYDFEAAEVFA